jgi:itaconate CoA-transferase
VAALQGITIIALEHAIAAPFCTRQLAELGARVLKVERPETGDFARDYDQRVRGLSSHFVWVNRSKESITLDLKQPQATRILSQLIEHADVLVQNLAPGAAARLGLSFETLAPRHPQLIVCDISGYGPEGPYRDKKAYDLLIQSEAGFLSITGSEAEPAKAGISIADIAAGTYAYSNILAALIERERTGRGRHIEISLLESMAEWMGFPMYFAFDGASPPPRAGSEHATIYPYGPFPTGDGKSVFVGVQNEREWQRFCREVLERPELLAEERFATNSRRSHAREELRARIAEAFAPFTVEQIIDRLDAAQIANARMNTVADLWQHPQLRARNRWTQVDTPVGPLPALLPPGAPSNLSLGAVPALGAHTHQVLLELGYDEDAITRLRAARAI